MTTTGQDPEAKHPVQIPPNVLAQLAVADVKAELLSRNVRPPSKLKKQGLLDLLSQSLHMTVAAERTDNQTTTPRNNGSNDKSKLKHWKTDHPIRKLLYFEFKEGNTPLDPNEMRPVQIYCKHHLQKSSRELNMTKFLFNT